MTDCLPQQTYSVYVDGELSAEDVRRVETHVVGCESCRALIRAFRDEATTIADIVLDRPRDVISRAPARARASGLALGLVPTLSVAALVVTTLGWLMETGLPAGASWLNPMKLIGVYEVAFDMIFMLRDSGPAFFELTIALGATASVAAILIFLVSALGRRVIGTTALLGFVSGFLLANPLPANALELRTGDGDQQVAAGEIVDEDLFISGDTVTIDGTINGDLAAFGERIVLRGLVRGNVFAGGREVDVLGTIEGSLHAGGRRVTIEGKVLQSVYAGAETLILHERGDVGRDALLFGKTVQMEGRTGRDLFSAAERVEIRGSIGRDASTRSERMTIYDGASITRNLHYELGEGDEPDIAPGARIGGETTSKVLIHEVFHKNRWLDGGFYMGAGVFMVSVFLAGLLLHWLLPRLFLADLEETSDFFRAMGYGLIALIGTPIAIIFCFITVVGIPIGVLGLFLYLTGLFLSIVVVASVVGTSITAAVGFESEDAGFGVSLLVGLVVVLIGINLPFVGGLLRLLVVLTGLGLLIDAVRLNWYARQDESYAS